MTKYRKKTPIEAEQFDGSDEMIEKYRIGVYWLDNEINFEKHYFINTLEGRVQFYLGDWIVTGIKGEHWAIADEVFKETYEEVE